MVQSKKSAEQEVRERGFGHVFTVKSHCHPAIFLALIVYTTAVVRRPVSYSKSMSV